MFSRVVLPGLLMAGVLSAAAQVAMQFVQFSIADL